MGKSPRQDCELPTLLVTEEKQFREKNFQRPKSTIQLEFEYWQYRLWNLAVPSVVDPVYGKARWEPLHLDYYQSIRNSCTKELQIQPLTADKNVRLIPQKEIDRPSSDFDAEEEKRGTAGGSEPSQRRKRHLPASNKEPKKKRRRIEEHEGIWVDRFAYIHVLDVISGIIRVEIGPQTYARQHYEKIVAGPEAMVLVPRQHYAIIQNPIQRNPNGTPAVDVAGQVKIRHGDEEVRREGDPFPLYPGEKLYGKVSPLQVVAPNTALKLRAVRDVKEESGASRVAGDEWLFRGPGTYIPRNEVQVVEIVKAKIIMPLQALRLRAKKQFTVGKVTRQAGEEYLYREVGAYMPEVEEEIIEPVSANVLTDKKALHLRAIRSFVDRFNVERKAGEEWLVTLKEAEYHIPDVFEHVVGEVPVTILSSREFCIIVDPVDTQTGKPRLGSRVLRKGEDSFFLKPGEKLESGILKIHILESQEALLLRAREAFLDGETARRLGDRWMIHGPCEYIPPVSVEIVEKRRVIPLDETEGIYIRDVMTGRVRSVMGESYILKSYEELWEKELPAGVEELLAKEKSGPTGKPGSRDRTRVVVYKAPHNTAVQIYDYKIKKARVAFGPDLVVLGPEEQFTVLSLSGDKPKRPHVIKALALQLGPDFMTDIFVVETADHARLSLKLSYNWHFEFEPDNDKDIIQVFGSDFVGDTCKTIAARVRGVVSGHTFEEVYKNSARFIKTALFGVDENGQVNNKLQLSQYKLVVFNVDVQSVEALDASTRDMLQKFSLLATTSTSPTITTTTTTTQAASTQPANYYKVITGIDNSTATTTAISTTTTKGPPTSSAISTTASTDTSKWLMSEPTNDPMSIDIVTQCTTVPNYSGYYPQSQPPQITPGAPASTQSHQPPHSSSGSPFIFRANTTPSGAPAQPSYSNNTGFQSGTPFHFDWSGIHDKSNQKQKRRK